MNYIERDLSMLMSKAWRSACFAGSLVLAWFGVFGVAARADAPVVAAASDLQFALVEVADAFKAKSGRSVRLNFGSSGNFARQIRQNAPFQVFFSANEDFVKDLTKDGFTRGDGELYAIGRIVLIVPKGSPLKADATLIDLKAALTDGRLKKFAIANPEHAPYGARAEEALRHAGLWEAIAGKLVLGENVSQAAQFATSGNAEGGIIAYSLALAPQVSALGSYALVPAEWHKPLRQAMVLTKSAGATAEAFFEFARSPEARLIFRKYGFVLPGEAS
jgi:molybdate transport system substrate-binding protein